VFKLIALPFRAVRLFFKLSGVKGGLLFGLGVAVGLLVAPQTGPELRARLQARLGGPDPVIPSEADLTL
jgi:hypothetical protein